MRSCSASAAAEDEIATGPHPTLSQREREKRDCFGPGPRNDWIGLQGHFRVSDCFGPRPRNDWGGLQGHRQAVGIGTAAPPKTHSPF
jgi:hypothetical protein